MLLDPPLGKDAGHVLSRHGPDERVKERERIAIVTLIIAQQKDGLVTELALSVLRHQTPSGDLERTATQQPREDCS